MNLQTIQINGCKVEYVLLPIATYQDLRNQITEQLKQINEDQEYEVFDPTDYVDNPVALARIQAAITQEELAKLMKVTQAYVSKIENQEKVTSKLMQKVTTAITKK